MDTVDQKLDEVLNALAYEKIVGGAPKSESDPLLALSLIHISEPTRPY